MAASKMFWSRFPAILSLRSVYVLVPAVSRRSVRWRLTPPKSPPSPPRAIPLRRQEPPTGSGQRPVDRLETFVPQQRRFMPILRTSCARRLRCSHRGRCPRFTAGSHQRGIPGVLGSCRMRPPPDENREDLFLLAAPTPVSRRAAERHVSRDVVDGRAHAAPRDAPREVQLGHGRGPSGDADMLCALCSTCSTRHQAARWCTVGIVMEVEMATSPFRWSIRTGIPPEAVDRLFERFSGGPSRPRLRTARARSGLGRAIARELPKRTVPPRAGVITPGPPISGSRSGRTIFDAVWLMKGDCPCSHGCRYCCVS